MRGSAWYLLGLAAAPILSGCGFASLGEDEQRQVADGRGAEVRLIGTEVRLPSSATEVRLFDRRFQDSLQWVRFEAPLADARRFAEAVIGRPLVLGEDPGLAPPEGIDWWFAAYPIGGEGGSRSESRTTIGLVLQPRGALATVWMRTVIVS
ncbi:hypothetical protein [Sphingosinicella terrae]|uniref:hypothetical protein n=1 Tax=Sphingosinicella terrae TaxID=2172047 RepID=UPI000E0CF1D4|nr:hypothetical protein [Sphingosinicella terrae]